MHYEYDIVYTFHPLYSVYTFHKCTIILCRHEYQTHCTRVHISKMHYDIVYTFHPLYSCTQIWCTNSLWIYNCINILLRFYKMYIRNESKILKAICCVHYTIYTNISLSTCTLINLYNNIWISNNFTVFMYINIKNVGLLT